MSRPDKAYRQAVRQRMAATGERYTVARRHLAADGEGPPGQPPVIMARRLHTDLVAAFTRAGWPVTAEGFYEYAEYRSYPGPAAVRVGRAEQYSSLSGDEDPDDIGLDLTLPPQVDVSVPLLSEGPGAVDATLDGALPAADLVDAIDQVVAGARAQAISNAAADDGCRICDDPYPAAHLLVPTVAQELRVCPACVFDGDMVPRPATAYLAYQFDQLHHGDVGIPAGWTAVVALLACAARPGLDRRLHARWRQAGTLFEPAEHWARPGDLWVWLPPAEVRPAALGSLGAGASLQAVVAAIDRAHPTLRDDVRAEQQACWEDAGGDDDDEPAPDEFVEAVWPAVVAYAVTFATQAAERATMRGPWHVTDSFDELASHLAAVGCDWDAHYIESTITCGLRVLTQALGLDTRR